MRAFLLVIGMLVTSCARIGNQPADRSPGSPPSTSAPAAPAQPSTPALAAPPKATLESGDCPAEDQVIDALKGHAGGDHTVELFECQMGRFPAAGWATLSWSYVDEDEHQLHLHVLGNQGATIVAHTASPEGPSFLLTVSSMDLQVVDLDGDGVDELLRYMTLDRSGIAEEFLEVWRIAGTTLERKMAIQLRYDDSGYSDEDAVQCAAQVQIAPPDASGARRLLVSGKVLSGDPARAKQAGCMIGQASYRL